MRGLRSSRTRSLALAAVVSTLLTSTLNALAFADSSAGDGELGLQSLGFLHVSDLTLADGNHPVASRASIMTLVGSPAPNRMLLLSQYDHSLITFDTSGDNVRQSDVLSTPNTTGDIKSTAVDSTHGRAFFGTGVGSATIGCGEPALCMAGPLEIAPQLVAMDLVHKSSAVYQFPPQFDATNVVALTSVTTPAGRTIVYALLYSDPAGTDAVGRSGNVAHVLDLVALDADALAATDNSKALLWSYSITSCSSLPGTATNGLQDYLGIGLDGLSAYFICRGNGGKDISPPAVPAGAVVVDFDGATPYPTTATAPDAFRTTYYPQGAGATFSVSGGDQAHGLAFLTALAIINKQYVFDVAHRAWTGSVPFTTSGDGNLYGTAADASSGRDYVVYARDIVVSIQANQLPAPQGTELALGDLIPNVIPPAVEPTSHTLFLVGKFTHRDKADYPTDDVIALYRDVRPQSDIGSLTDPDALTHDEPITPETPVSYGAFASGYGARATFVGGTHSTPAGIAKTITPGFALETMCANSPDPRFCFGLPNPSDGSRSLGFGVVDGVEATNAATKASAASMEVDDGTQADAGAAGSFRPSDDLWNRFGPADQPAPETPGGSELSDARNQQLAPAQCADLSGKNPPAVSSNGAQAVCHGSATQQASAGAVSPTQVDGSPLQIGYATSSTSVGRVNDVPVTIATAEASGIRIAIPGGPTVDIGRAFAEATSQAAGRTGTAKSTYTRILSNVSVRDSATDKPYFSCGFAGAADGATCDPRALTDAVSAQSPSPVLFLMPTRDTSPAVAGSPGGAQAEVIKNPYQYWNDYFANADSNYEVPALQVIVVGDQAQPSRLVLNLAGVHVESHQVIGTPPPPPPPASLPSLKLTLLDDATPAAPLAGATFTLTGSGGATPLSCLTAADGIGTCHFDKLEPGSYTLSETTAPPGYAAVEDYPVTLEAGHDYTTSFVNLRAIGAVNISLSSPGADAAPLPGGVFALLKGADVLATPLATCTTDEKGACGFKDVPLGDYTMQQVTAPEGFLASDAVAFSLKKPAQIADLKFVDGVPGKPAVPPKVILGTPPVPPRVIPGKPAVPPKVIPGTPAVPPRTMVLPALDGGTGGAALEPAGYDTSAGPAPIVASQPAGSLDALSLGSGGLRAVSARLAKLVIHSPQQAVLLLFVWLVLGLPVYLWVRRRQFITATEGI